MKACTGFGHAQGDYDANGMVVRLEQLIVEKGVDTFFTGLRGAFDETFADAVCRLRKKYPDIRLIKALAYRTQPPQRNDWRFDHMEYLMTRDVHPRYAIVENNHQMTEICDFILSGVKHDSGGAFHSLSYAIKRNKVIIPVDDDADDFYKYFFKR